MRTRIFSLVFIMLGGLLSMVSQEKNKFRAGLDLGYVTARGGGGILVTLEPKYNVADNMNVGIRISSAALVKEVRDAETKNAANVSYLGTFDYYFHNGTSSFAPYLGGGLGYYDLASLEFDDSNAEVSAGGKFGGLIRGGFELGKFRFGVEYNVIPKSKSTNFNLGNATVSTGEIKNSYFGISLGFYLGGGKWKS